jgi:hypothetical protein
MDWKWQLAAGTTEKQYTWLWMDRQYMRLQCPTLCLRCRSYTADRSRLKSDTVPGLGGTAGGAAPAADVLGLPVGVEARSAAAWSAALSMPPGGKERLVRLGVLS